MAAKHPEAFEFLSFLPRMVAKYQTLAFTGTMVCCMCVFWKRLNAQIRKQLGFPESQDIGDDSRIKSHSSYGRAPLGTNKAGIFWAGNFVVGAFWTSVEFVSSRFAQGGGQWDRRLDFV
jgi:hypothetical protein